MIPGKWSAKCRFFLSGEVTRSSPVLEIKGGGGPGLEKKFFRPFGPHFGLKIGGGGGGGGVCHPDPGPSPGSDTGSNSPRNKYLGLGESFPWPVFKITSLVV